MPHFDKEEFASRPQRSAERLKHLCFRVGYVLGQHFTPHALAELAELLHYAEENFGPTAADTFSRELEHLEQIPPKL
jgi:hypothetical protein